MTPTSAWLEFPASERIFLHATCSIGRAPENRIVIPSDAVSRRHAILRCGEDGAWALIDTGSSNGTYLNGQRVSQPVPLRDSSIIEIGPQKMTFRLPPNGMPAVATEEGKVVDCWLLCFAATLLGAREPSEEAEAKTFENWSARCQRIVKKFRGATMRAVDDSFLAFWPVQSADTRAATVASALRSLRAVQQTAEEFRFALHFGSVTLKGGEGGEFKAHGPAVIHAIQLDRAARVFTPTVLVTESAKGALEGAIPLRPLGASELRGYRGTMRFFTIDE